MPASLIELLVVVLAPFALLAILVDGLLPLGATEALTVGLGLAFPLAPRLVLADLLEVDDLGHAFLMPRKAAMR